MNSITDLDIEIKGIKKNKPKLKADGCVLPFYQTKKSLNDLQTFNNFIKNVEKMIRKSKEYKHYKDYLMNEVGLNYCAVFPNINTTSSEDVTIEMHHGPILTLYDYCSIVTNHFLENNLPVTSFRVYYTVIEEHYLNNVQVVMLCDLAHKLFHNQQLYINPKQAWGHLDKFVEKYSDGIDDRMFNIINKNLEMAEKYHSYDKNGILTFEKIERWDK